MVRKIKCKNDVFWKGIDEANKDPDFVRAVYELVRKSIS